MKAFLRGFVFAFQGLAYVMRTQRNARVHALAACLAIAAGVLLRVTAVEWAVLCVTIGVVFSAEMVNTVAELAVDQLTQRQHPLAKTAKDVGAGAVLVTAIAAVGVGLAVFGPRVWDIVVGR